ncbi:amidase family protein [Fictibacillus terranigra]|uniref:Amidase family protein n=1 Tax=Fictibacillus terranigra TaxID=3058424 RepID=A0ABT8E5T7_9BACL|nr:amidase family protein [Fictibacillus sp. CENA-BCM004]MDN4073234.1 amidase family protein [Fictibacillus sp. CENA-BCM004]
MTEAKDVSFVLEETTIADIQNAFDREQLTSEQLVRLYLQQISRHNLRGSKINAVIEMNPDALHIAESLDAERLSKGKRGPLHGIPVLLKDNINTGDAMHTSAGSLALADSYALEDAGIAAKLRVAGAVILGKTNMTEWANFMTENMPNGFSSRGGQVLNPYGPGSFDVSGSSSGSGAAVAANFAVAAIGTETSGSILCPASANGIVGIKPTTGLLSRFGIIPISTSQDTAGPMARTVTDAAILLGAMTGVDERDSATNKSVGSFETDYTKYLQNKALEGARIGICYDYCTKDLTPSEKERFDHAIETIKQQGGQVILLDSVTPLETEVWDYNVLIYEFKSGINHYLKQHTSLASITSLQDIIAFNKDHSADCLQHGQVLLEQSEKTSGTLTEPQYLDSRLNDLQKSKALGIDRAMKESQLDALLYPGETGYGFSAKAGYPSISVPAGYDSDGRPFGIVFTSSAFKEPDLIRFAYSFEQATLHRVPPKL